MVREPIGREWVGQSVSQRANRTSVGQWVSRSEPTGCQWVSGSVGQSQQDVSGSASHLPLGATVGRVFPKLLAYFYASVIRNLMGQFQPRTTLRSTVQLSLGLNLASFLKSKAAAAPMPRGRKRASPSDALSLPERVQIRRRLSRFCFKTHTEHTQVTQ